MTNQKILTLEALAKEADKLRFAGKKIVLCHGTFDLMHAGHIRYLQRAKKEGDVLMVTVTADDYVNKGPGRPVFGEQLRAENLAALECVNYVAINHAATAVDPLEKIRPSLYVKGAEYRNHADDVTGNIAREIEAVEKHGGAIFYTDEITFSSSRLLNEHFDLFKPETKKFLEEFTSQYADKDIHQQIDSLSTLKVLVVGDAIIDQYHYVSPLGQTGKGNILAVQHHNEEQFAGGALAVANHVSQFVKSVDLLTGLGRLNSHEEFIRDKLQANVNPIFTYFKDAPTVTKRRFVDSDLAKFFEIYFFEDNPEFEGGENQTLLWMDQNVPKYDLVVVADFGNGLISDLMVELLCNKSKYLAINTQINSGNRGFHVINRYGRADFVSLNEPELRLAAHNKDDSLEEVCKMVASNLGVKGFAVTRGTKGVILWDAEKAVFNKVPALSTKVVDRIGAGDAFLSLASLCMAKGLDLTVANFIGSVAAAMDVQIVCNREPIDRISLKKICINIDEIINRMLTSNFAQKLMHSMTRIRRVEEALASRYPEQEMRCPMHLCIGQEAIAVGVSAALNMTDKMYSNHRAHGHYLAKGGSLKRMVAELYGRASGCCGGRGGSMHMIDLDVGFMGATPIVGGTVPLSVGSAWASKLQKKSDVSVVFFGDGCFEEGVLHESLNFAALHQLPILFVCENNDFSVYTRRSERQPPRPIHQVAAAHGIKVAHGDGNDVQLVFNLTERAIADLRSGQGPWFLEFFTYRTREHCGPDFDDHLLYRSPEEVLFGNSICPIKSLTKLCLENGLLSRRAIEEMTKTINVEIEEAFRYALADRKPTIEDARAHVYAK